jgi:predicted O-methyltransferase YrrM
VRLARGRKQVVELGTGTGWSTIALALADGGRRVVTYDPHRRPAREAYLDRAWPGVRGRIDFREAEDTRGPQAGEAVEFLFIDSSHDRESVVNAFAAWRRSLVPGAVVVFHDFDNPQYPGVREAISELSLAGRQCGGMYVWRAP